MSIDLDKTWEKVQGLLNKELKGPRYQTWIRPTKLISVDNLKATIAVKNEFSKSFLKSTYLKEIISSLEKILKVKLNLEIVVDDNIQIDEFVSSIASLSQQPDTDQQSKDVKTYQYTGTISYQSNLSPSYTFENFIVGTNNEFCHAVSLVASETGRNKSNPLFIYSGVGLGKTHLVNAIGNSALGKNNSSKIKYLSSESFTNELISSIRTDTMTNFRNKFRNLDILIIDDVQFLEGKEATQEEFFHTFNALKEKGKQVILTSDRPPSSLTSLTDRLRSRFEGGLIADMQAPNLETRMAILMLKAKELEIEIEEVVAEYMAQVYSSNVRELEGALKRVHAYLTFSQKEITLPNVQKVLRLGEKQEITPLTIVNAGACFYGISVNELLSTKKSSHLTLPRHVCVYILHKFYGVSFPRISQLFSKKTHTSSIYAYNQIKRKLSFNPQIAEDISAVRRLVEKK